MLDTVARFLSGMASSRDQSALRPILNAGCNLDSSQALTSAGLAITGAGTTTVKTGASTFYAVANGVLVSVAAATNLPTLVGTVNHGTFNVFCFYEDSAGTLTSAMGTAGATLSAVKFPLLPALKALVGFIIINPTGTGNFVGGTTNLDDATVAPNTVYVNPTGAFDTTVLLS
jgi:hypothetical protein